MRRAAIYARRSTDEHQVESLVVQQANATTYIDKMGWTLAAEHVFLEDAVSRAEFKKRPALIALLNAASAGEFDIVVVRDESRIGGDTFRSGIVIQDILDAGMLLYYYFTDEQVTLDNAVEKFLVAARSFAAELEREKTSQRTHEHLLLKARRGLNVGGRVFGYDNIQIMEGTRRIRTEYRINITEAEIIREIFRRYADGEGIRTLVKDLNARGVPSPRAGKRGTGSWSPSVLWAMLRRERYRGHIVWGQEGTGYKGGTQVRIERPECEWVQLQVEDLRIVSEELWQAVRARMDRTRKFTGKAGSPGPKPKYLLTGFAKCSECGGPMQVTNGKIGSQTVRVYMCSWHRDRGDAVCTNTLRRPVATVDEAVLSWMKQHVLTEELIIETLKEVRRRIADRSKASGSEIPAMQTELKALNVEIARLTVALAATDEKPHAVIKAIADKERRVLALKTRIDAQRATPTVVNMEIEALEQEARRRIEQFRELLDRNPEHARKAMDALLESPLTFTPIVTAEGNRYRVEGPVAIGNMFATELAAEVAAESGVKLRATPTCCGARWTAKPLSSLYLRLPGSKGVSQYRYGSRFASHDSREAPRSSVLHPTPVNVDLEVVTGLV